VSGKLAAQQACTSSGTVQPDPAPHRRGLPARARVPVLAVETFTDPSRPAGTCYAAAGFTPVGATEGYGRRRGAEHYSFHGQPKTYWLRPLHRHALAVLAGGFPSPLLCFPTSRPVGDERSATIKDSAVTGSARPCAVSGVLGPGERNSTGGQAAISRRHATRCFRQTPTAPDVRIDKHTHRQSLSLVLDSSFFSGSSMAPDADVSEVRLIVCRW
jgi:hypothetical protein